MWCKTFYVQKVLLVDCWPNIDPQPLGSFSIERIMVFPFYLSDSEQ